MNRLASKSGTCPGTLLIAAGADLSVDAQPAGRPPVPFRAHVQRVFHPGGAEIRGHSGDSRAAWRGSAAAIRFIRAATIRRENGDVE